MVVVRALLLRDDSEVAALIRSWSASESVPEPEPVQAPPPGVPMVAAQMFGGTSHNVKVRYVSRGG